VALADEKSVRSEGHEPQRRCIGCGKRGSQAGLLRLTVDRQRSPATVVQVVGKEHPGRGAYLCRRRVCLDKAVQRRAFQQAFRENVAVDIEGIVKMLMVGVLQEPDENDTAGG
jgi:predicted RNA-binding protein YlxR (DUF448 family)